MDKQRLEAARKKLKEFQRSKKSQAHENVVEHVDLQKHNDEQKLLLQNFPNVEDKIQGFEENVHLLDSNGSNNARIENANEYSNAFYSECNVNNSIMPTLQDNTSVQNLHTGHESINGSMEIPFYNFTPEHRRNESSSTASSQVTHENIDQNNHYQNSVVQPSENNLNSLQKEHLLQMANAVANVLVNEQGLSESALNNCDLEQRNQFLTSCLEEQKKLVNQLHIQLSQSNSRVSELEAIITTKDAEYETKFIREINPLKEQIQLDAQTIGILVGEKAELTSTISQTQEILKNKTEDVIELSRKLKVSNHRINELERELMSYKNNVEQITKSHQELQKNYEDLEQKLDKLKKENEDFEFETSELRQKLDYKNTELINVQQELQEKIALLSLSELRMQQLSKDPQEMTSLESQHHTTKMLEQQLSQMKEILEIVNGEKDEVNKKYQSYVQQLDERYAKVSAELELSKKVIVDSEIREQSYIQRLSDLEQQLQKEKARVVKPVEDQSEKIGTLTKTMDNLVLEQENLQSLINERDNEIEILKRELNELQDIREKSFEATKLATALQSEQLGASRAVSQNHQLKTQLDEMHDAFIALSNTKLDLTEKLQAERTIGKKLNAKLNDAEQQVEELKEQLLKKEEAVIQFQKEKLQTAQIEDQILHYQAQSHSSPTLQQELQKALLTIESLKKENQLLLSKSNSSESGIANVQTEINEINSNDAVDTTDPKIEEKSQKDISKEVSKVQPVIYEDRSIASISEPMKKLESRFKETMEKLAELTDEKQRLEYLVLQLQGETETIGEYITLYQKQRAILQARYKERDNTFRQILEQRNEQQMQLHKLKVLVGQLLKNKNSIVTTATVAEENMPFIDYPVENESNNIEIIDGRVNRTDDSLHQNDTASQILDLLTEIKDCNNSCNLEQNFHPCPWCSGKLITV